MTVTRVVAKVCACGVSDPELFSLKSRKCKECVRLNSRAWRLANPDRSKSSSRAYYLQNREHYLALRKKWTEDHVERHRETVAKWSREHPERTRAYSSKRNALKRAAEGSHSPADVARIYAEQSGLCFYCLAALNGEFEAEHKTPLSRGGSNWPSNICCSCKSCNRRKSRKTAEEYVAVLQRRTA